MSGVKSFAIGNFGVSGSLGVCLTVCAAAFLGACSSNVSRFDYAAFANNSSDSITTSSLNPVPAEAVYAGGAPASATTVERQDLPPPQQQYASAQPEQVQRAPLPPRQNYAAPPPAYQPPAPQPQASYQPPAAYQPSVPPPAPQPPANTTISVKSGDTLYKLANEHGVTVEEIKAANDLRSTRLSIGQKLVIPGKGGEGIQTAAAGPMTTYTVKRGDSVAQIASEHGVSRETLQDVNDLKRPYIIQPGDVLKIPGSARPTAVAQSNGRVRLAARGANVPLPASNPTRDDSGEKEPDKTSVSAPRPQQKVAARTENLPRPEPMAGNQFRWPVKGRIMSGFGPLPNGKHNDGINVAVPKGTEIKAAENGVVAYAGSELEPYGNLVLIRHANNWVTAYAHNDELMVKRGDTVQRGQVIAKAGQSGNVTQPQLHFELRKGSKPVDPLSYMASNSS